MPSVTFRFVAEPSTASNEPSSTGSGTSVFGPLSLGVGVAIGLGALHATWEYAFGHLGYIAYEHSFGSREMATRRIALTLSP